MKFDNSADKIEKIREPPNRKFNICQEVEWRQGGCETSWV